MRKAILAAAATQLPRWAWSNPPALQTNPFALGVASGDPAPDGVVLWTRLALTNPAHPVRWEVAHDARFARIVQKGEATAVPALGHSVHVELRGLAPGRWYHYRFMLGDAVSATGRSPALHPCLPRLVDAFNGTGGPVGLVAIHRVRLRTRRPTEAQT